MALVRGKWIVGASGKPVLQKSPVLIKMKYLVVDSGFLTLLSSSTESLTDKSPARTKEW